MRAASLLLISLLALGAVAVNVCTGSKSDSHYHDCQMGWATQHPSGAATGGEGAATANIYTCTTRAQFVTALTKKSVTKRIIYVKGTIRADDLGNGKYADTTYYQTTPTKNSFNPTTYLSTLSTSGLLAFRANMQAQIMFEIQSGTSIIGVGTTAQLLGFWFRIKSGTSNIVIRNVYMEAPRDVTSEWSSGDGWNAEMDGITIEGGTRIWVDHVTMSDGRYLDSSAPMFKGEHALYHDGMLDMKRQADYITISNSIFEEHDKTNMIGHSDSFTSDTGYLRITMYGNIFKNNVQRQPRVRFGKIHLLENYFQAGSDLTYFVGLGKSCNILSEYNIFPSGVDKKLVKNFKGKNFADTGSWVGSAAGSSTVNSVAKSAGGSGSAGWTAPYKYVVPTSYATALAEITANAGSGKGVFASHRRSDFAGLSSCTPSRNCTQECGAIFDGCMLVFCGICPMGSLCNGTACVSFNDYVDSSFFNPVNASQGLPDWAQADSYNYSDADDFEESLDGWVDNRSFSLDTSAAWTQVLPSSSTDGWSSAEAALQITAADNVYHLLKYKGFRDTWSSEKGVTKVSVVVSASSGTIGVGMRLGQPAGDNDRLEWLLTPSGSTVTSKFCKTIAGVQSCVATGSGSWKSDGNSFTVEVSNGAKNISIIAHLNGDSLVNAPISNIPKESFSKLGSVFLSGQSSSSVVFSSFAISSATVISASLSSCHTESQWNSFTNGLLGQQSAKTYGVSTSTSCAARRDGLAAFSAFETVIADDLDTMTPSSQLANVFTDAAVTQGAAASEGFTVASLAIAAPTVEVLAATTASTAAALSTGAIIGIAVGASVGGLAVVGAVTAGVVVAVKNSKKEEPKRSNVRMELSTAAPDGGINVMNPNGEVHSSITARSAPVAV